MSTANDIILKNLLKPAILKTFNLPAKTITNFSSLHLNNISNLSQLKENINIYKNLDSNQTIYLILLFMILL